MLRLVVGLGNDEPKYELTPHNIGFHTLDALAESWGAVWKNAKDKVWTAQKDGRRLAKARGYMNHSGQGAAWAAEWWQIPPADCLIVLDDFALPWGRLRFRHDGTSGGHNGLESVLQALGTEAVPRLRIGVGPVPPQMDPADYVLRRQSAAAVRELAARASEAVGAALTEGLEPAMNRYNGQAV